jgi:hypothetical protein
VDAFLRKVQVYLLALKADMVSTLWHFVESTPLDSLIEQLITNQGGKYMSTEACEFLHSKGIKHTTTLAHTPEFNGVAEHFNQTIMNMVHCLLHNSGLVMTSGEKLYTPPQSSTIIYLTV